VRVTECRCYAGFGQDAGGKLDAGGIVLLGDVAAIINVVDEWLMLTLLLRSSLARRFGAREIENRH
jgi:hypothetical protein